jgi:hypothetical protein
MQPLPPSWYQAIFLRHSRRSFMSRRPEKEKVARLEALCREFRPFPGARAELVRQSPDVVFKGLLGAYGRITGAFFYVAFIGSEGGLNVEEGIGYTGEGVILEATALGLGTCWVSGFFRPEAVKAHLSLAEGERVFAVTPIGYAERDFTFKDKIYRGLAGSRKRKSLQGICDGRGPEPWQDKALESARLAPSAANRQPWRFGLDGGSITVRTDGPKDGGRYSKRLDCGIAMLHLELGAAAAGISGRWVPLRPPEVARFEAQK